MPDRLIATPEADTRFQFEVVKNLAESVRQTVAAVGELRHEISEDRKSQSGVNLQILERLARIESNKVNEEVADLRARHEALNGRVDQLELDRAQRVGGNNAREAIVRWWPVIGAVFTVLFLLFRATGILHLPSDDAKPPVIVPLAPAANVVVP